MNISGKDVEQAMMDCVQANIDPYLAEVGMMPIRSWRFDSETDKWPESQLPSIVVVSPGISERPIRYSNQGRTMHRANWVCGVGIIVSARTEHETRHLCQDYMAVVRRLIGHHPGLDGAAEGSDWIDERYDQLDDAMRQKRSLFAGIVMFQVQFETAIGLKPDEELIPVSSATVTVTHKEEM
jgi:hypothetical protein